MEKMGTEALYRRPIASTPAPGYKTIPTCSATERAGALTQVWAMDIT